MLRGIITSLIAELELCRYNFNPAPDPAEGDSGPAHPATVEGGQAICFPAACGQGVAKETLRGFLAALERKEFRAWVVLSE